MIFSWFFEQFQTHFIILVVKLVLWLSVLKIVTYKSIVEYFHFLIPACSEKPRNRSLFVIIFRLLAIIEMEKNLYHDLKIHVSVEENLSFIAHVGWWIGIYRKTCMKTKLQSKVIPAVVTRKNDRITWITERKKK